MHLRKLEEGDAPLMLEWMHDPSVVEKLYTDFASKTLADARDFIAWSRANFPEPETGRGDLHLAIADDGDEYLGTVSLRRIGEGTAEFAITIRKSAMGTGAGWFGMSEILKKGFAEYGLQRVYWCVSPENERAVRFYRKHDFGELLPDDVPEGIRSRYPAPEAFLWFAAEKK